MAGASWADGKWRPDFTSGAEGRTMWMRYFVSTALRAVPHGEAAVLAVLEKVDVPVQSSAAGSGWFAAKYPAGDWLILLNDGENVTPQVPLTTAPFVTQSGVPGHVDPNARAAAVVKSGSIAPLITLPSYLHIAGHGLGAQQAPVLAFLLAAASPGSFTELLTFGTPSSGDAQFVNAVTGTWIADENPWDPVAWLPLSASGNPGLFGLGAKPPAPYTVGRGRRQRWQNGHGYRPGSGIFSSGVDGSARYNDRARAYYDATTKAPPLANHALFFYVDAWYGDTMGYVPSNRQAIGEARGYDLAGLDDRNALLSQADGLTLDPTWPVPATAWPTVG